MTRVAVDALDLGGEDLAVRAAAAPRSGLGRLSAAARVASSEEITRWTGTSSAVTS